MVLGDLSELHGKKNIKELSAGKSHEVFSLVYNLLIKTGFWVINSIQYWSN
jgi:hypothetical protein